MRKIGENYECYSKKLYGFLVMKGAKYERRFKHNVTGKTCWVYIMTPELAEYLQEWNRNRPTNN